MSPNAREVLHSVFTEDLAGLRTRALGPLDFPVSQCRGEGVSLTPLRVSSGVSPDSRLARPQNREGTKSHARLLPSECRCKPRSRTGAQVAFADVGWYLDSVEPLDLTQFASAIVLGVDGVWRPPEVEAISYPADGNDACFAVEENSFWFAHRNAVIAALIGRYLDELEGAPFADIGGGNGFVALAVQALGLPTLLVEPGPQGAARAHARGLSSVVEGTLDSCRFRDGCLAGAGMFDVVEHIADDVGFLRETRRALRPGGLLFIAVPAYPLLWSHEDAAAGHQRRYTAASMSRLIEDAGFEKRYLGHFFRPLPPLIGLLRALPYRMGLAPAAPTAASVARDHKPGLADRAIRAMLTGEVAAVARGEELAFGGSILVAARRPR